MGSPVEKAVFPAPVRLCGTDIAPQFPGLIDIAVVEDRTVVARKDDDGIVGQSRLREVAHQLTYTPIGLKDRIAPGSHTALSGEPGMRNARDMRLMKPVVEEERTVAVGIDKALCPSEELVGHLLVAPTGRTSAPHEADARNTVDNRTAMSHRGFQAQHFGVRQRCGFTGKICRIAHLQRV